MSEESVAPQPSQEPRWSKRRLRWIAIGSATVVVVAIGVPLLIVGLRGNDIGNTARALADALSNGDRKAFRSVVCQNVWPQPSWPDQLDRLHSVHVTVTGFQDPGGSSDVVPSATLAVDDTGITFSVAVNKYDKRISDHPCVFALDQATPVSGH